MRTLVTGGAGFIGSHLVERLLADGHQVVALDNLSTGRLSNLASVTDQTRLVIHQVDVTNQPEVRRLMAGTEWVFHLAALADIVPSIERPWAYYRANVEGTLSMLEAARAVGVKRLLYAASSSCYGIPDVHPTPEDAPIRPQYPYALTKWLGEQLVLHWAQVYRLPVVSLRLFNVYGPRARTSGAYGAVFGVFLAQKLAGQPFTVVGDGSQTRDFTYVTDVVEAFLRAATSEVTGEVFNVGSGSTSTVNRLVELLGGPIVHIPKRPAEPDCTFADTTKIRRTLGWEPRVNFETGVRCLLEHLEDWRDAPVWTPETIEQATRTWFEHLSPAAMIS
ncbi:MAG: SDR family oxidoreductase [Candidatus Omnitrophica bacterium]|nr:SDR family oxidoreductase [Candidatus Omnitrophota bacterium]